MKQWLRALYFPVLLFAALTLIDYWADSERINWLMNIIHSVLIGAIGCVGQYLIHKNILHDDGEEDGGDGCINCGKS